MNPEAEEFFPQAVGSASANSLEVDRVLMYSVVSDATYKETWQVGVLGIPAHLHPERSVHADVFAGQRRELASECRADVLPHPSSAGAGECIIVASLIALGRNKLREVCIADTLPLTFATAEVAAPCEVQREGPQNDSDLVVRDILQFIDSQETRILDHGYSNRYCHETHVRVLCTIVYKILRRIRFWILLGFYIRFLLGVYIGA